MAVYTLTRDGIRDRVEYKIRTNRNSTMVNNWINDVLQNITAELFFQSLYEEDDTSLIFTGAATPTNFFDLPEETAAVAWMYSRNINDYLEEVSFRQMMEEWAPFDTPTQTPRVYAPLGRTGAAGANGVPRLQIKFESKLPTAEIVYFAHYKLHPELDDDTEPILLPQNMLNTIVDGVLIEADSWSDSDQFAMHRDRYENKVKQLKKNQNAHPNRRRTMGRTGRRRGRPGRVGFPANYPDIWGY